MKERYDSSLLQSQTIDWLRFPLAVAVVFIHSFGINEYALPSLNISSLTGMDIYNLIRICFSHVLTQVAVPIFYLISGFLFFLGLKELKIRVEYLNKVKSRFRTLVIPYILWNVISILSIVGLKIGAFLFKGKPLSNIVDYFQENGWLHLFWNCNVWGEEHINWLGVSMPWTGPSNFPLWFLRDLIVVVLLTPLIYWLIKHLHHYFIWILAFCYISGIWFNLSGFGITSIFFFSAGAYFSISGKNLVEEFRRVRLSSFALGVLLFGVMLWYDGLNTTKGNFIYPLWIIADICVTFNLAVYIVKSCRLKIPPLLSNSSFFIYAIHTLLILRVSMTLCSKILHWNNPLILTIRYFMVPILTVCICLMLYWLMQKYSPKILSLLTGNRSSK